MKPILGFLAALVVLAGGVVAFADDHGAEALRRVLGFFRAVPVVPASSGGAEAQSPATAAVPEVKTAAWIQRRRDAERAFEQGSFALASRLWTEAAALPGTPSREMAEMRGLAGRARIYELLTPTDGVEADGLAEPELKRRMDAAASADAAAGWIESARYAAAHGLRHHLAYLLERAFARRNDGTRDFDRAVAAAYRTLREGTTPPRELAEAVERELPTGEAADMAREDTGGIGGAREREGDAGEDAERDALLAEARRLKGVGDREYRLAVPGSDEVNVHRRKALDAFEESRRIFEELERKAGSGVYQRTIHDLNRNIAELHKDLPIGK